MQKIQKYLYYLLLFVTPFIMLSNTSELFEFNKLLYIYIIAGLILCIWLARMVEAGKLLFKRTPFDLFIGLFFLSQLISTFLSIDVHTSIFGYYGRFNGGLLSLISYLIIYYSLVEFMSVYDDKKGFINMLMKISLAASTLVILWGLPGKTGHDLSCLVFSGKLNNACWTAQFDPAARMFSTLGQPNWLGAYLAITFFISVYYFLNSSQKTNKLYPFALGAITLLQIIAVFFTNSRSSVLALFFATGVLFILVMLKKKTLHIPLLKEKALSLFILFFVSILIFKTGVSSIDKYISLSTYFKPPAKTVPVQPKGSSTVPVDPLKITDSLDIRKIVWQGAEKLGMEYPLFGTGVETFAYSYYFVRPQAHNLTSEWDYLYNKAHNEYLNYFATTGFFGIGTYLLFVSAVVLLTLFWIRPIFAKDEDSHSDVTLLQAALFCAWTTILITNFVGFSTTVISLYFYLIPALLFYLQIIKKPVTSTAAVKNTRHSLSGSAAIIGYGVSFILAIFFVQYFISYWLADTKYAMAENLAKANDYQNSVMLLNQAMQLRPDHVYEDKLSYYLANLSFIASYQKNAQLAKELMQASDKFNAHSLQESPQNILYWKTKVKNLYIYYQITLDRKYVEEGVSALLESEKLSPTDPKLPYFLATYYSLLYDEEKDPKIKLQYQTKALEQINTSIQLKSDYFESYYLKAQLLKKYRMIPQAKETYEFILQHVSPGNAQVKQEMEALK